MAKKTRNKNNNMSPARNRATSQKILPARSQRKSGKYLTLAIMGGAAIIALNSCDDNSDTDNDGDGVFFSSVQECVDSGNSTQVCADAWNNAKSDFENTLPKNMTQPVCVQQFSNCYYDNIGQSWVPILGGFLLSKAIRRSGDDTYIYHSGGSSYTSRPVWRTSSGDFSWKTGSMKSDNGSGYSTRKASTVSRGGYGHSSSARGSWGG